MARIIDLDDNDKPREKAERFGIEALKDEELLALIIGSGTVGHSVLDIARDLLKDNKYLWNLTNKSEHYFHTFKGLKKANALKLLAALEISRRINEKQFILREENNPVTSESLYRRYFLKLSSSTQEQLVIIILNKNKEIVREKILYLGDDNCVKVNYRDILRLLMIHNGYYFYLIHNHPNNSHEPSQADIVFTKKIDEKTRQINVKLLDHIIISKNGYYSFLHAQLLQEEIRPN